ncbi:MAG: hypothetical protein GY855_04740 [candidate division Zixibacteria bacterium]|nr:hypothetical protein [candidate division Zixibacteria bacterium]
MYPTNAPGKESKNNKPGKIGILVSHLNCINGTDLWELIFLYCFLEKARFHVVNIYAPDLTSGSRRYSMNDINGCTLGEVVPLSREIGKEIKGLIIPGMKVNYHSSDSNNPPEVEIHINSEIKRFLREIFRRKKPIAAVGYSVRLLTAAIGDISDSPLTVTIGNYPPIESIIERNGCVTVNTRGGEVVMDETNRLITTAGHYGERKITTINAGMENLVAGLLSFIK